MKYKYYLAFKNQGNGYFEFDNAIVTDGEHILQKGGKIAGKFDPNYINNSPTLRGMVTHELVSLSEDLFSEIWSGGKTTLGYEKKVNYKTNAPILYVEIPDSIIKSTIEQVCTKEGISYNQAMIRLGIYLFRIGDTYNYIHLDRNNMNMVFKNNGDYSKASPRSSDFICEQLNIPYKKTQSMNIGGISQSKPQVKNSNIIQFEITKEQIPKIYKSIIEKVVAQDETVKTVLYNIFMNQRIINTGNEELINSSKANIILDGPTGTGKTLMLKLITEELSLPMVLRPVTAFSTTGYKGADLNELLIALLDATNGDLELAQRGVIALDEFDKLSSNDKDRDLTMKLAVQQELLSYISGAKFELEYNGKKVIFDTSKLTFIGLGAFNDLRERKINENEKKYNASIGFNGTNQEDYERQYSLTQEDYIEEGLMRELVGRFTTITATQLLTKEKLKEILYNSKLSPLKGLQEIGKMENITITVDDDVIDEIATLAYENGFGARGLQTIFNNIKNVVLQEILLGETSEIRIDMSLFNKSKNVSIRSY